MARPVKVLSASDEVRAELRRRANGRANEHRERFRAGIILQRLQGVAIKEAAARMSTSARTVSVWSSRFERSGLAGLDDKDGRGRKPSLPTDKVARVITEATRPPTGRTRWSVRSMARHAGMSHRTVQRIWVRNDLKPHIIRTFKLSNDPKFEEKFWDVIGLYLNPPEKALVLCCDEKSQCQALERSQPGLPLAPRHPRTQTHDYRRHGTVTLFAALNYLEGTLISRTEQRHSHVEWLRFLKQIDREAPEGPGTASDRRQLRHPQACRCPGLAGETASLRGPFHTDRIIMDEPRRAIFRRPDRRRHPLRKLHLCS
jgi:transposase